MRAQIKSKQSEAAINPKAVLLVVIIVSAFAVVFYDGKQTRPKTDHASPSPTLIGIDESTHLDLREPPTIGPFGRPIDGRSDAVVDHFVKPTGFRGGQDDDDEGSDLEPGSGNTVPGTTVDDAASAPSPPETPEVKEVGPVEIRLGATAADGEADELVTPGKLTNLNADNVANGIRVSSSQLLIDRKANDKRIVVLLHNGRELTRTQETDEVVPIASNDAGTNNTIVFALDASLLAKLKDIGEVDLHMEMHEDGNRVALTRPLTVAIDTAGPVLRSVEFVGSPTAGPVIHLEFNEDQFAENTYSTNAFKVERIESTRFVDVPVSATGIVQKAILGQTRNVISLHLTGPLPEGIYRVRVIGAVVTGSEATTPLRDAAGNFVGGQGSAGNPQEMTFGIQLAAPPTQQVQFPEFLPALPQPPSQRLLNPGDRVVTTVVRLFYSRDAHRIAQIVNRSVRSYNRSAVTLAEQHAEDARDQADALTDERAAHERQAVQDAEDLRSMESYATGLEQQLQSVNFVTQATQDDLDSIDAEIRSIVDRTRDLTNRNAEIDTSLGQLTDDSEESRERIQRLNEEKARNESEITRIAIRKQDLNDKRTPIDQSNKTASADASRILADVRDARADIANQRQRAQDSNEQAIQLQAQENRARENQFRLEVAAAQADPDTYAPGLLSSVDPVAQVSISVIGEGLIQLRGPRKGIDAIRTMIHQMDAPVGQVKVEIVTVQVNGERADRMEAPLGEIEAYLGLGNFLTAQSLMILRQCIVEEAAQIAMQHPNGHLQVDRDRRYLYAFFGRDFIDELYEMDSEFLFTENKLLGLHSMDTMSLHQALFVLALAKNDVRQNILARFMDRIHSDLIDAEFNFRRSTELFPHKTNWRLPHTDRSRREAIAYEGVALNNMQRYHFTNLLTFFGSVDCNSSYLGSDTINPTQREFLKLAQIFKARLICELELKQRIIERTMIESSRQESLDQEERAANVIRPQVIELTKALQSVRFEASNELANAIADGESSLANWSAELALANQSAHQIEVTISQNLTQLFEIVRTYRDPLDQDQTEYLNSQMFVTDCVDLNDQLALLIDILSQFDDTIHIDGRSTVGEVKRQLVENRIELEGVITEINARYSVGATATQDDLVNWMTRVLECRSRLKTYLPKTLRLIEADMDQAEQLHKEFRALVAACDIRRFNFEEVTRAYGVILAIASADNSADHADQLLRSTRRIYAASSDLHTAQTQLENAEFHLEETRGSFERQKLLDFLIEEQEERLIDLLDGSRSQIAAMDDYLKRLSIAIEDDLKIQFFDPAFVHIRDATRSLDVQLGVVERTSILTNNRALAKVTPQATMEFDLPKRNIAIVEALDGAKALAEDYGALLQDPTFLSAYQLMGGGVPSGKMQNIVPGSSTSRDEEQMGITHQQQQRPGSALENLIPDPSIYKFETGTGYEIRPVIQPDGNSIIYDFNYMYTTEIREPVRADEKHLGRIRRHFINTQVHTSSFEMRELSRYQVALKASRTSQGVPLLQDIPGIGVMFRPLPSDESSIQQNIILARSVVYPTLFDLMGLRWAPSVVDLNHIGLRDSEHVTRGRSQTIADSIFDITSDDVDQILGIPHESPEHYRRDLYHRQRYPSPYHPGGHRQPGVAPDPSGRSYQHEDRRPQYMRNAPAYDPETRNPVDPYRNDGRSMPRHIEYYRPDYSEPALESLGPPIEGPLPLQNERLPNINGR